MYAVVEISGKLYKVAKGEEVLVDLQEAKDGAKLSFETVTLLRGDKDIEVGKPYVAKAKVTAEVKEALVKGEKLVVFKYKQKVPSRKKTGHRQKYTKILISDISKAS